MLMAKDKQKKELFKWKGKEKNWQDTIKAENTDKSQVVLEKPLKLNRWKQFNENFDGI